VRLGHTLPPPSHRLRSDIVGTFMFHENAPITVDANRISLKGFEVPRVYPYM